MSSEPEKFVLAFSDEYDSDRFQIATLSFNVLYVGAKERRVGDVGSILYEFETDGKTLLFKDGSSTGTAIYMTLSEPPAEGQLYGQAARVGVFDKNTGQFLGLGRASLFRIR